jgi:hypothetical protein
MVPAGMRCGVCEPGGHLPLRNDPVDPVFYQLCTPLALIHLCLLPSAGVGCGIPELGSHLPPYEASHLVATGLPGPVHELRGPHGLLCCCWVL